MYWSQHIYGQQQTMDDREQRRFHSIMTFDLFSLIRLFVCWRLFMIIAIVVLTAGVINDFRLNLSVPKQKLPTGVFGFPLHSDVVGASSEHFTTLPSCQMATSSLERVTL